MINITNVNKKPFLNALTAILYIIVLVGGMNLLDRYQIEEKVASFIMPVIMISLFTFSAAFMAYLFCLEPIQLYLDGKKEKGISLFIKTVLIFGALTLGLLLIYLLIANLSKGL